MFKKHIYKIFSIIILTQLLSSCLLNNLQDRLGIDYRSKKRVPTENQKILAEMERKNLGVKNIHTSETPITPPQTATYFGPGEENNSTPLFKRFSKKDQQGQEVMLKDEVAENNIVTIKSKILEEGKLNNSQRQVKKPNNKAIIDKSSSSQIKYYVQVGTYSKKQNASNVVSSLRKYSEVDVETVNRRNGQLFKVKLGPFKSKAKAQQIKRDVAKEGFADSIIVSK